MEVMEAREVIREIKRIGKLWDKDISALLGVSEHSVNMWYNGRTIPQRAYAEKLCEILEQLTSFLANGGKICCRLKAMEVLNCKI